MSSVKTRWARARKIYEARHPERGAGFAAPHWDAMSKAQRSLWLPCADAAEAEALPDGVDVSAIMEMFGRWQSGYAFDDDNDADVDLEQRVEAELAALTSAPAPEDR